MREILNVANIWSDFIINIVHVALLSAVVAQFSRQLYSDRTIIIMNGLAVHNIQSFQFRLTLSIFL